MSTEIEMHLADLAADAPPDLIDRISSAVAGVDRFVRVSGALGTLWVAFGVSGVNTVYLGPDEVGFRTAYSARWRDPERPLVPSRTVPPDLRAVLDGRRPAGSLRYDLSGVSGFGRAVLEKAAEIPKGEVRSYAWVAREIGHPAAVRAVGTALGRNPVPVLIPCHRVVRSDGRIGNYGFGPAAKAALLGAEGFDVESTAGLRAARR